MSFEGRDMSATMKDLMARSNDYSKRLSTWVDEVKRLKVQLHNFSENRDQTCVS